MKRRELAKEMSDVRAIKKEKPVEDTSTSLYDKYRPKDWSELVGQAGARKILQTHAERGRGRQFLLFGPSGTGKTTAARIMAKAVGCHYQNINEIPAAVFSGVDNMRGVQAGLNLTPLAGSKTRVVIVDECQRLSMAAWESLLKAIEEPGKHVYWFFCTTDAAKVPKTIKTRCVKVEFKPVSSEAIRELLCDVCDSENFDTPDDVIDLIVKYAEGSPREALSSLSTVAECENKKEAAALLSGEAISENTLELCRFLMKGGSWAKAMNIVEEIAKKENPESVRIAIVNYVSVACQNAKTDREACRLLGMLDCFATPYYNAGERFAPLLRSIGQILFAPSEE